MHSFRLSVYNHEVHQMHKLGFSLLPAVTVALAVLMTAATARAQSPSRLDDDGWRTIVYPIHAWLPVFGADVTLPGQSTPPGSGGGSGGSGGITIPSAKTSGNFNGAALAGFRIERSRSQTLNGPMLTLGIPF